MEFTITFGHYPSFPVFELEISQEEDYYAQARLIIQSGLTLPPP